MATSDDNQTPETVSMPFPTKAGKALSPEPSRDSQTVPKSSNCANTLKDAEFTKLRTSAEESPDYFTIQLPSGFVFYSFKTLSVKLVNGRAQGKFTRASKEKSLRYTVEAISSLLGDNISAFDLTLKDFYYVMYWLRLGSYPNKSMNHLAVCTNAEHADRILDSKRAKEDQKYPESKWLDEKSVRSLHTINSTVLEEKAFDKDKYAHLEFPALKALGITLTPVLMSDVVNYSEFMDPERPDYEEVEDAANLAGYIGTVKGKVLSYVDRMAVYNELNLDAIEEIQKFADAVSDYGVEESIKVKCPGCGAEIRTEVSISAHSFL